MFIGHKKHRRLLLNDMSGDQNFCARHARRIRTEQPNRARERGWTEGTRSSVRAGMAILEGLRRGFTPITQEAHLPTAGSSVENATTDFKVRHVPNAFELAKDVASFSNASGGTILIGARATGDLLAGYEPLTSSDANAAKRSYEQSVRDRCSPAPIFDVSFISSGEGTIVAVNVWPMPGQPVGVELLRVDLRAYEREAHGTYFFPVRIGSHTRAILPEQLPMFIDAKHVRPP